MALKGIKLRKTCFICIDNPLEMHHIDFRTGIDPAMNFINMSQFWSNILRLAIRDFMLSRLS